MGLSQKQAEGKGSVFRPGSNPSALARCHLGRAWIMTCLTIVFVTAVVAATFVALIIAIVQAARHWED